jgi:hypothetical protein
MNHITTKLTPLCLLPMLFMFAISSASAQVEKGTLWRDAVVADINVDFGGTGFHASYHYRKCDCGDLFIQVEQDSPDSIEKGDLLLIDGQTLLSRGFEGQGNDIAALIQAPLLMLRLTDALLSRSQPQGPYAVEGKQTWDDKEPKIDFSLNTGFATGTFVAPWGVKGTGWKTAQGHFRFELIFDFVVPTEDDADSTSYIAFSGNLDFLERDFPLPETTVLNGWNLQHFSRGEDEFKLVSDGLTLKALRAELLEPAEPLEP